ncbi:AsnC family transcriptional regulator [Candidatus Woesearchaeota archaeon]|nr:AsnC family transcriptional regulator [Candidatus Woesearchaeota archaeon]
MLEIDKKDRRLLYYLSRNSRESYKQLGKKIGVSESSVGYRIQKLKKRGIIINFTPKLNYSLLGHIPFIMLFRFNEDIYDKKEIIKYFKEHDYALWAESMLGQWDLMVEFSAKNYLHLIEIIKEITEHFGETLNSYEVSSSTEILKAEDLIQDIYQELKLERPPAIKWTEGEVQLTEKDKQILKILTKDASLSYMEIARKLKLTFDTVRYRIKNLEKKGIIAGYSTSINLSKLGYTEYLFKIKLSNISKEKYRRLRNVIRENNNIVYASYDININSFLFICAFKTPNEIGKISKVFRKNYSDIIEKQDYWVMKEVLFIDLFLDGILK